jgi:TPP-dependent pyruvate/acetoin dehydrogenase alpha subunit
VRRARSGAGASLLVCKVMRYYGHFEGDQQTYRGADEVKELRRTRDCLDAFARRVTEAGAVEESDLSGIDEAVRALMDEAVSEAQAGPDPGVDEVLTDVYVKY